MRNGRDEATGPSCEPAPRPVALSLASMLWVVLGAAALLVGGGVASSGSTKPGLLVGGAAFMALGGYLIWAGWKLRRRRDTRRGLTIAGAILSFGLWPVLLAVPAILLHHHRSSRVWLTGE